MNAQKVDNLQIEVFSNDDQHAVVRVSDRYRVLNKSGTVVEDWRQESQALNLVNKEGKWHIIYPDPVVVTPEW